MAAFLHERHTASNNKVMLSFDDESTSDSEDIDVICTDDIETLSQEDSYETDAHEFVSSLLNFALDDYVDDALHDVSEMSSVVDELEPAIVEADVEEDELTAPEVFDCEEIQFPASRDIAPCSMAGLRRRLAPRHLPPGEAEFPMDCLPLSAAIAPTVAPSSKKQSLLTIATELFEAAEAEARASVAPASPMSPTPPSRPKTASAVSNPRRRLLASDSKDDVSTSAPMPVRPRPSVDLLAPQPPTTPAGGKAPRRRPLAGAPQDSAPSNAASTAVPPPSPPKAPRSQSARPHYGSSTAAPAAAAAVKELSPLKNVPTNRRRPNFASARAAVKEMAAAAMAFSTAHAQGGLGGFSAMELDLGAECSRSKKIGVGGTSFLPSLVAGSTSGWTIPTSFNKGASAHRALSIDSAGLRAR
eukprot:CAMPEP_0206507966 /NCGR_PEP_ID=MMETSP0324_2-20121206/57954_1 /ASSEMBLY_ACC=CAM_ASM_000836 /TAXON_ID=2866 /ORGANISM="Crypthecodinium cohnii, Strain Seligo" /LENGTH=414 /DNA_ID=CAMNT_0053998545 /DNA_START=176 /DNA_END=1419 /DNA_ORIENTATION=-